MGSGAALEHFVPLRQGLILPRASLELALALEPREVTMAVDAHWLVVGPADRLTDEDRTDIRRWRHHLRAIVALEEEPPP
jgi:hypothetical protein